MDNGASPLATGLAGAEAPEPQSRLGPTDGIPSAAATRKVAINGCYGGFRLSSNAFVEYLRRKGKTIYAQENGALGSSYWETPIGELPAILREPWYKAEDKDAWSEAAERAGQIYEHDWLDDAKRDDPDLIAVIEEMGDEAASRVSKPYIVEIPADVEWEIKEYVGIEWVAEKHRTWS